MNDTWSKFKYPTEPQGPIPAFNTIEKEAEFWDTHDVTDFSELGPDDFPANPNEYEFPLERAPTELKQLVSIARARGVSPTKLVEGWVKERVQQESPTGD